jgi:murein L,D-transpeptidase YafK
MNVGFLHFTRFPVFFPGKKLPAGTVIDRLVVFKSERKMEAWANGALIKTYSIALGGNPLGHKQHEGDRRTPEGTYTINNRNPRSRFYKNLGISYPNDADCAHAASIGKPPGGDIKIHGLRNGRGWRGRLHLLKDWTHGCIAVTNPEIDELYTAVKDGAVIVIFA